MGTVDKMFQADQDFAMGRIITLALECFAANPHGLGAEPRQKLVDFSQKAVDRKVPLTKLEQRHLNAAMLIASEDWMGAMNQYEDILADQPLDTLALHMGYLLALTAGKSSKLRELPQSVVKSYRPSDSFYGHVHGKLAFGQCEMGEYERGEANGRLALEQFRLDNWAHHSLAHIYEETGQARKGVTFLEKTEADWGEGKTFDHHLWWHKALMHVSLGEHETALGLYDDRLEPARLYDKNQFSLSDGSALLLRLQLQGADIGDRAEEQSRAWQDYVGNCGALFYDGHLCFSSLQAGDRVTATRLKDSIRELVEDKTRKGWNKEVCTKSGQQLIEGIQQFFDGEYRACVATLGPVMEHLQASLGGSKAQKDIFRQILIHAGIRSGHEEDLAVVETVLQQKVKSHNLEKLTPLDQKLYDTITRKQAT